MCAGVPFHTYFHWGHPLVIETKKWLTQTFPYESLYNHFMKFCSSFIRGKNSDKIFAIFSGKGNNSKSMILKTYLTTVLTSMPLKFQFHCYLKKEQILGMQHHN